MESTERQRRDPTVFIVDDDAPFRRSLEFLVGSVGFRTHGSSCAGQFFESYPPRTPGCLLLDLRLPDASGMRVLRMLDEKQVRLPTILMSAYADVRTAVDAMRKGAVDFLVKPLDEQRLLDAVQQAVAQDEESRKRRWRRKLVLKRFERLTQREREVMGLVVSGRLNKQIAAELEISVKTVEDHRAQVMNKMHAGNLAALVKLALVHDLAV